MAVINAESGCHQLTGKAGSQKTQQAPAPPIVQTAFLTLTEQPTLATCNTPFLSKSVSESCIGTPLNRPVYLHRKQLSKFKAQE